MSDDRTPQLRPSRHHGTPQPLRPGSRFLTYRRVEVHVHLTDGTTVKAPGAFETRYDARKWADRKHPDPGELVEVVEFGRETPEEEYQLLSLEDRINGRWGSPGRTSS